MGFINITDGIAFSNTKYSLVLFSMGIIDIDIIMFIN